MARVLLTTVRLLFVFQLLETVTSLSAFAGWDSDCVKKQIATSPEVCDKDHPANIADRSLKTILTNPATQDRQTSEFFWDFLKDQHKQTGCEANMLSQIDLFPSSKFGGGTNSARLNIEHRSSYELQKTILSSVFKSLPHLSALETACESAQKRVDKAVLLVRLGDAARGASQVASKDVDNDYRNSLEYKNANQEMAVACSAYENSISGLWSGGSASMNAYIKQWVQRYQKGSAGDEKAFLNEALPVDDEKNLNFILDPNLKSSKLVFQKNVIEPLELKNNQRLAYLAAHMHKVNNEVVPDHSYHDYEEVRTALFEDGGQAAISYLNRSKYQVEGVGLSCQLMHHYWETPERRKKYKMAAEIAVGGVAVLATGGAAAGIEGLSVAVFVADLSTVAFSLSRLPKACKGDLEAGSLEAAPVCEMFATTETGKVPETFSKEIESRASCAGTILETTLAAAGAVGSYGGAIEASAKLLGKVEAEAGTSALSALPSAVGTKAASKAPIALRVYTDVGKSASVATKANRVDIVSDVLDRGVRRTKAQAGRDYLPKDTDPEAFAQNSYKTMRAGGPETETPAEAITRALNQTDETQLKRLQDVAIQRQITRYKDAQARLKILKASNDPKDQARAEKLEAILKKDPVALGNGPHIQEILDNLDKNKESIRTIFEGNLGRKMTDPEFQHAYQYMRTVVAVHDLGKTFPAEVVMDVVKSFDKQAFLKGRIALHEVSSSAEIQWLVKKNNLDPKMADFLVRDILGHNDGSGLPDVFWNAVAQKGLGDYVKPDSPFSSLMAFVDRGGQGTLGETGGVMKITNQQIGAGKAWGKDLLQNETMLKNAQNTNRQMEVIVDDFGKNYGTAIKDTPMVQALENENQRTADCFHSIKWNSDNTSGVVAGQKFANKDEFFKIVNGTENDIKAGKLPQDYWAKQVADAPRAPAQVTEAIPANSIPLKVSSTAPTRDFTQLPAYGLSDTDRVNKAEQELQRSGLLKGNLTPGQKELLKNHLNEPGAAEPSYGTHTKPELKSKFKQAKAARDADPNEGYTQAQVDYLIRGGFAGQSGISDAHAAIDAQAALRTKQAFMERNRFPGNPNSAHDVMMSVDSASASALDRTIGNNDKFAKIRDELLGDTSAYKKPGMFSFLKAKPPELTDYAKAARDYAGAVQSNNLAEAAKQKIIMNRLIVEKLRSDPSMSQPALSNLINTLQQMGTY